MLELVKIGRHIAVLRKKKGLTGEKLGEILNVSPQAISKWENGKCLPETMLLPKLAKILGCTVDTLLMPRANNVEENDSVSDFYENINEEKRLELQTKEFTRSKDIISRYLFPDKMEIADIGGGTGPYSFWLAEKGHNVHLLDLTQKHIDIAKKKNTGTKLASYTCADARDLPYANKSMDMVLLMGALYHLQSYESRIKCLTEAYRVLKNGGHLISTVINRYMILFSALKYNIFHYYSIDTIEKIIKTGICEGFSFPQSYFHTPNEIIAELTSTRFEGIKLIAVEGIAHAFGDNSLPADDVEARRLLKCVELTESTPELMGVTRNLIAVGRKGALS